MVSLIKAGVAHKGCAVLDVISPCVTFNDHEGSTKSYAYTRAHQLEVMHTDFVPPREEIAVEYEEGEMMPVTLHDGSTLMLKKADRDYDPTDRSLAMRFLENHSSRGEVVTGLLFIDESLPEMHDIAGTSIQALANTEFTELNPGSKALAKLQARMR